MKAQPQPFRDAQRAGLGWALIGISKTVDHTARMLLSLERHPTQTGGSLMNSAERKLFYKHVNQMLKTAVFLKKLGRRMRAA